MEKIGKMVFDYPEGCQENLLKYIIALKTIGLNANSLRLQWDSSLPIKQQQQKSIRRKVISK